MVSHLVFIKRCQASLNYVHKASVEVFLQKRDWTSPVSYEVSMASHRVSIQSPHFTLTNCCLYNYHHSKDHNLNKNVKDVAKSHIPHRLSNRLDMHVFIYLYGFPPTNLSFWVVHGFLQKDLLGAMRYN